MSSKYLNLVWKYSRSKSDARLLLVAMADHADHEGIVRMDTDDLRDITKLNDEFKFHDALQDLLILKEVKVAKCGLKQYLQIAMPVDMGNAALKAIQTKPIISEIKATNIMVPMQSDVRGDLPQSIVGHYLQAAGIDPDMSAPLYWFRKEHEQDAHQLTDIAKGDTERVVDCLSRNRGSVKQDIKRLTQLRDLISPRPVSK